MTTTPASRRKLPDDIMELLRTRIFRGELAPGDRLPPERELAPELGTNRNTLREAIRALEAQGLVKARQGDGVRVLDFRKTGEFGLLAPFFRATQGEEQVRLLSDLVRIRRLIATEAVILAARRATDEEVAGLRRLLEDLVDAKGKDEFDRLARTEIALYRAITVASKSLGGMWMFNSVEKVILSLLDVYPDLWVTPDSYLRDWKKIVDSIEAKDTTMAGENIAHLLTETDRLLLGLLGLEDEF